MKGFKDFLGYLFPPKFGILFRDDCTNSWVQLFRYFFVGFISFVADTFVFWIAKNMFGEERYMLAEVFGFIVGVTVNFLLTKTFAFKGVKADTGRTAEIAIFLAITLAGLGWTELLLYTGVEKCNMSSLSAKVIAAIIVLFWNYGMKKFLLYKTK